MSNPRTHAAQTVASAIFALGLATSGGGASAEASLDWSPVPLGPAYPSLFSRPRYQSAGAPACSSRAALCVHAGSRVPPGTVLTTLHELEGAARTLMGAIGAPPPLSDGYLGGGPAFDLYLVPADVLASVPEGMATGRDDAWGGPFDRTSAFALLREDMPAGCARQNLVARSFAAAIEWGLDAGEDPAVRDAVAAYLAELVTPCGEVTSLLVDDFQAHPERALFHPSAGDDGAASAPFPWYLDALFGRDSPGSVPLGLAAIGTQKTPPAEAMAWRNEPDLFDVLGPTLKARNPPMALDDLLVDFAVARLFMGARDDGVHWPASAASGDFGRVRFDWRLPFATLPRRVVPERPIEPTGSTYTFIGLSAAPPGARLAFRMEWEAPVVFRWALVRLRPDGSEASRVLVTPEQKSTSAEKSIEDLDGLGGLVVVGVNVGDLRPGEPFDPDGKPYDPHGYVLTVSPLP